LCEWLRIAISKPKYSAEHRKEKSRNKKMRIRKIISEKINNESEEDNENDAVMMDRRVITMITIISTLI